MAISKLSDKFRKETSWNGLGIDVLKSGLQKYIRRGNTEKALYCAAELDLFKEAPERGEVIRTNFLHRLMVIYLEDVANITIFQEIDKRMNEIFKERTLPQRSKEKEERLISEVVTLLAKSKKARICSHIRAIFNPKYNVPVLLDKYPSIKPLWDTITLNKKGGTPEEEFEHNCQLFKKYLKERNILAVYYAFQIDQADVKLKTKPFGRAKPVWFIFKELCMAITVNAVITKPTPEHNKKNKLMEKLMDWYQEHLQTVAERFLCWLVPLLYHMEIIPRGDLVGVTQEESAELTWDRNRRGEAFEVDDFVVDRHTRQGAKKTLVEFAINGAKVENEAEFVNPLWKQFYEDGKRWEDGEEIVGENKECVQPKRRRPKVAPQLKESEEYTFVIRTQLVTSRHKQDVYFAKNKEGKLKVVKGPFKNLADIETLRQNTDWKIKHSLPYIPYEVKEMIPDRWPEGTPLGLRNSLDRTVSAYFLVFDSVYFEEQLHRRKHSSKLWPETEVMDWEKIQLHFDYKRRELTEQEMKDYVHNILYRYLLGIPDLADRNFLMVDGRVISIDEEVKDKMDCVNLELRKNKCLFIQNWLRDNYEKLDVGQWSLNEPIDWIKQVKLEEMQNREFCLKLFTAC